MERAWLWISVLAGVVVMGIIASSFLFSQEDCRDFKAGKLQVNGKEMKVALALSDIERTRGLAGCTSIPERSGMYFPYDQPRDAAYWMKGMVIPIDIIWVANGQVVGIEHSVPVVEKTAVDPPQYRAPEPITGVLEIGAGKAAEYGITVGSTIHLLPG